MDAEAKKKALRMINYGMYILTAKHGDEYGAATVNWLSQASFEPPLVMVGVKKDSNTYRILEGGKSFAVNVVGKDQKDLAANFFKPATVEGNRISGSEFETGKTGAPLLLATPAYFECEVTNIVDGGDHSVVVGEVVDAKVRKDDEPLFMRDTAWFYGG